MVSLVKSVVTDGGNAFGNDNVNKRIGAAESIVANRLQTNVEIDGMKLIAPSESPVCNMFDTAGNGERFKYLTSVERILLMTVTGLPLKEDGMVTLASLPLYQVIST